MIVIVNVTNTYVTTFVIGKLVLLPADSIKLRLSSAALTSASNIENLLLSIRVLNNLVAKKGQTYVH